MSRSLIVTGCDANHYDLATDLVTSLRDARGRSVEIGFIHVGDDEVPEGIAGAVDHIAHVPDPPLEPGVLRGFKFAYLMLKPMLPDLFPGFDIYVWMDGDTWVQNPAGLDVILHSATLADVCMHPEQDPNYYRAVYPQDYMDGVYVSLYGQEEAAIYARRCMLNCGILGARAGSPVWRLWSDALAEIRNRYDSDPELYFSDQIPLHRLVMSGQLSVTPLRAVNNWLAVLATPAINVQSRRLHAPTYPYEEINIIHLVGTSKSARYGLPSGGDISLRYWEIKALFAAPGG